MIWNRILSSVMLCAIVVCSGCADNAVNFKIEHQYDLSDPQFRRTLDNLVGPPLISGNSVETLNNGDEIFPAMIEAIRGAKHHINFETYVYWRGEIGRQFTEALVERAREGVRVRIIFDSIGSAAKIDRKYLRMLTDAGAKVEEYEPVAWYKPSTTARINNRTHRKILVVDGKVGFIGGVGIGDEWLGDARSPREWRDMHYRVHGPVVLQLQSAFCDNWMKSTGEVLHGPEYFPKVQDAGNIDAQVVKSDALGGSESIQLMFLLSMAAASHDIRIGSAYFVPDDLTVDALVDARRRGVRVQIIVPGPHLDVKIVKPASRAQWGKLLEAGVEIYEFEPTMYHTKLMVVDDRWVSIGSTNIDNRSFKLNDEANLNVMDETFAADQARFFDEDVKRSKRYTIEDWKSRSIFDRLGEGFASLFAPLM